MSASTTQIASVISQHASTSNGCACETPYEGEHADHLAAVLRRVLGTITLDQYISRLPTAVNGKTGEGYEDAAVRAWKVALEKGTLVPILTRVTEAAGREDEALVTGAVAVDAGDAISDEDFALLTDPVSEIVTA